MLAFLKTLLLHALVVLGLVHPTPHYGGIASHQVGGMAAWKECVDSNGYAHEVQITNAEYLGYSAQGALGILSEQVLATSSITQKLATTTVSCPMAHQSPLYDTPRGYLYEGYSDAATGVVGVPVMVGNKTLQIISTLKLATST